MNRVPASLKRGWRAFKGWWLSLWFVRLYACAMRSGWGVVLFFLTVVPGALALHVWVDSFNPVLPREAMDRYEGELIHVASSARRPSGKIRIRTDAGEELTFRGLMPHSSRFYEAVGKRVTVWGQWVYAVLPPFYFREFQHVQQGEKVLEEYGEKEYQSMLKWRNRTPVVIFWLLLISLPSGYFWLKDCVKEVFLSRRGDAGAERESTTNGGSEEG